MAGPVRTPRGRWELGALLLGALAAIALLAPWLAPYDPVQVPQLSERLLAPSSAHWLGTDGQGRDVLSRLIYGTRVSLLLGLLTMAVAVTLGTVLGAVAGYYGGWWDAVISRSVDVLLSIPRLVLLIVVTAALREPSLLAVVLVLAFTQWPQVSRLVRAEVMSLRSAAFVEGARAVGLPDRRVLWGHIMPNALGPVLVAAALGVGDTIALEAGLSFLGLGVQPPTPSWGAMVAEGHAHIFTAWWISAFAGLAIVATVLVFNLAGEGLRRRFDPKVES